MRSSSEISAEMSAVSFQISVVSRDISKMFWDSIKMNNLCKQSKTLKDDVDQYDISQGGDWEGELYNDGVTYHTSTKNAAKAVDDSLTTLRTQLQNAKSNAEKKKKELEDKYNSLQIEYWQAVAAEEAAARAAQEG